MTRVFSLTVLVLTSLVACALGVYVGIMIGLDHRDDDDP